MKDRHRLLDPDRGVRRRRLLGAALAWPALPVLAQSDAQTLLRSGGVVVVLRHALAPGTFDPPQFRLGDCSTQRNLSDAGRAQARRIGEWFEARALTPARVRASPWCRCIDTAELAFGSAESWPALGSPRGTDESTNEASLQAMRAALSGVPRQRFEVWVTHMFVISALVGAGADSGEGLVLRADGDRPRVLARIPPA